MKNAVLLSLPFVSCALAAADELRMNQIQMIGTHNSYHIQPAPAMMNGKDLSKTLEYTHRPLPEQFTNLGMRQIEIDDVDPQQ